MSFYKKPATKMIWFGATIAAIGAIVTLLGVGNNFKRDLAVYTLSIGGACLITGGGVLLWDELENCLTEEYRSKHQPRTCIGCKFYHGECGINCAIHPEGAPGLFCKDWAGVNNQN